MKFDQSHGCVMSLKKKKRQARHVTKQKAAAGHASVVEHTQASVIAHSLSRTFQAPLAFLLPSHSSLTSDLGGSRYRKAQVGIIAGGVNPKPYTLNPKP
jgi:hypothetical protein